MADGADEHRRSAGGDDWTWDKVQMSKHADEMLRSMETEFLSELCDFEMAGSVVPPGERHVPEGVFDQDAPEPDLDNPDRITVGVQIGQDGVLRMHQAWMRDYLAHGMDSTARAYLNEVVLYPVLKEMFEQAVEKGWM